jgi:L-seryl-tRNA(Ser) seleniumtransferase
LIDLAPYGISNEPVVAESLESGISVVSFSGDKLLGGPQAGIIAGSRAIIDRVGKNPLMRALRVDKMTYAALEASLRLYESGVAELEVPVIRAIAAGRAEVFERATRFAKELADTTDGRLKVSLEDGVSVIGGGSAPEVNLATVVMAIQDSKMSAASLAEYLRGNACANHYADRTRQGIDRPAHGCDRRREDHPGCISRYCTILREDRAISSNYRTERSRLSAYPKRSRS